MDDLIDPTEMYLKVVLECEEAGIVPLRARLVERLEQAPSTVTQTTGRMIREGLFFSVPGDRQIHLSPEGRRLALQIMRKHRLAERLLIDVVGLEWQYVHQEACRWEHAMSDASTDRIEALLGSPTRSPYGNAIPTREEVERGFMKNLAAAGTVNALRYTFDSGPNSSARVVCIGEHAQSNVELLSAFASSGVLPGARITMERRGQGATLTAVDRPDCGIELDHLQVQQVFVEEPSITSLA